MSGFDVADGVFRPWETVAGDVLVLGAGFSKAVAKQFPDTDALGKAALGELRKRRPPHLDLSRLPKSFKNGLFETWLSFMAEDQPYLSSSQNLLNRAVFIELATVIREIIVNCESKYRYNVHLPSWFFRFMNLVRVRDSKIISLNYDTLVDAAIVVPLPQGSTIGELAPESLFQLHGSISKSWVPSDPTGLSVVESEGWDSERESIFPPSQGLEPFIIPPVAGKSTLYSNPHLRDLWARAHDALRKADRVFVLGYSLPRADTSMGWLMRDGLSRPGKAPEVGIVNLHPRTTKINLGRFGVRSQVKFAGGNSIPEFADFYIDETSRSLFEMLRKELIKRKFSKGQLSVTWLEPGGDRARSSTECRGPVLNISLDFGSGIITVNVDPQNRQEPDVDGKEKLFDTFVNAVDDVSARNILLNTERGSCSSLNIVDCTISNIANDSSYGVVKLVAV